MSGYTDKDENLLKNRIAELAEKCFRRDIPVCTDFLTLREQTVFHSIERSLPPVRALLTGGYETAERKMVCFLPSYAEDDFMPPFVLLEAKPRDKRFAENLTHRDYLGALMNLGIERECIGDLMIKDGGCYFYAVSRIADYLSDNLTRVKHSEVLCTAFSETIEISPDYERIEGSVASLRLDSILSTVFKTSRAKILPYIEGEKVFVDGRLVSGPDFRFRGGEVVSCRGMGKFRFLGVLTETKKGRLMISADLYR